MGRVTRRDPPKRIKDTFPGVLAGQIVGTLPPANLGGGTPGPGTVLTGDGNWTEFLAALEDALDTLGAQLSNEPVIDLGDPEDPLNPQFVFDDSGDIICAGIES